MKTEHIINHLSGLVSHMIGLRVNDFGEFHRHVFSSTESFLKELNLKYTYWCIQPIKEKEVVGLFLNQPLFRLDLDFKEDKRPANWKTSRRKGRILGIKFTPTNEGSTVEDILRIIRVTELKEQIAQRKIAITRAEENILVHKKFIEEATNEIGTA